MLRILGETAYPQVVPSARVRIADFAPFLRQEGVVLEHRPALTDREYSVLQSAASPMRKIGVLGRATARALGTRRRPHDLLLVHRLRMLAPFPMIDPPREMDVYDLDDALFLGSAADVNRRFAWAKQEARRCVACLRRARLVTAGNAFLADRAKEYAAQVEVVPSCVNVEAQPRREHAEAETLTVGWIGSPTTSVYVRPVLPALAALHSEGVRFRLVVVGADLGVREPWIEHRSWSSATQAYDLASFDVGLMPLPDTEWARGKCGYKLLQYFAAGVPAVASPVGVNTSLVGDSRGVLASTQSEWVTGLRALLADVSERRERGAAAREFVAREFSYQRWAPTVAELFRSVAR
jgi:hypothetical protein